MSAISRILPFLPLLLDTRRALPRGFMPLWKAGRAWPELPCIVNDIAPPEHLVLIQPYFDGRYVMMASSETWAMNGAHMMAQAYSPVVEHEHLWRTALPRRAPDRGGAEGGGA